MTDCEYVAASEEACTFDEEPVNFCAAALADPEAADDYECGNFELTNGSKPCVVKELEDDADSDDDKPYCAGIYTTEERTD
jgi:hypothetical protein